MRLSSGDTRRIRRSMQVLTPKRFARLVDLGLVEVGDGLGTVDEATGDLHAAERLAALNDSRIAAELGLRDTAEGAAA